MLIFDMIKKFIGTSSNDKLTLDALGKSLLKTFNNKKNALIVVLMFKYFFLIIESLLFISVNFYF